MNSPRIATPGGTLQRTTPSVTRTRYQWKPGMTGSTRGRWLARAIFYGLLPLFGGLFLGLGSGSVQISCRRAASVDCQVQEGFLFDLYLRKREAKGVIKAEIESRFSDEGDLLYHAFLQTPSGKVALIAGASNFNIAARYRLTNQINHYLDSPRPEFLGYFNKLNLFGLIGALTLAFLLWGISGNFLIPLCPIFIEWDTAERSFRYRARPYQLWPRTLPWSEIADIRLQPQFLTDVLVVETQAGKLLRFRNGAMVSRSELEALIQSLNTLLGRETRASSPAPPSGMPPLPPWLASLLPVPTPVPTALPFTLRRGSAERVRWAYLFMAANLAYLGYLIQQAITTGHFHVGNALTLNLLSLAWAHQLSQREETTVTASEVRWVRFRLFRNRVITTPLHEYRGVDTVEHSGGEEAQRSHHAYSIVLIHRDNAQRNVRLSTRPRLSPRQVKELAEEYTRLLGKPRIDHLTSDALPVGSTPARIEVLRGADGSALLQWPALRTPATLFLGLFFFVIGTIGVTSAISGLDLSLTSAIFLPVALGPLVVGLLCIAAYFFAKERLEIRMGELRHSSVLLGWSHNGETFSLANIDGVFLQKRTNYHRKKSPQVTSYLRITSQGKEMRVAEHLPPTDQQWLLAFLTLRGITPTEHAHHS